MNRFKIPCCSAVLVTAVMSLAQTFLPPAILPPRIVVADNTVEPMELKNMEVSASVLGLYSMVSTTIEFFNPNKGRALEGELVFPLPDKATVCGYALDISGIMVDGVVVPKEKARVAFESETRLRVDPGIVEHIKGNVYKTRIYPIPASGSRTVKIVYISPLAIAPNGDAALLLPMPREKIGRRSVSINVVAPGSEPPSIGGLGDALFSKAEKFWHVSKVETDINPGEDIIVAMPDLPASFALTEKDSDGNIWFCASVKAQAIRSEPPMYNQVSIEIIWDASGSRTADAVTKDIALIESLPDFAKYSLVIFRDIPEKSRSFNSKSELIAFLRTVDYDGGTDFSTLSDGLKESVYTADNVSAGDTDSQHNFIRILFSDGLDTLSGKICALPGKAPISVVSAQIADRESLRQISNGALIDLLSTTISDATQIIFDPPARVSAVIGSGIADIQGVGQPVSGRASVIGRLTVDASEIKIDLGSAGLSDLLHLKTTDVNDGNLLATAWASARVTQLSPNADDFADELLSLGRKYGLVSPVSSLIVLESLEQWLRHKIEPPKTQPQLREQWLAEMKLRGSRDHDEKQIHLDRLASNWKEHLAWWNSDFKSSSKKIKVRQSEGARSSSPNQDSLSNRARSLFSNVSDSQEMTRSFSQERISEEMTETRAKMAATRMDGQEPESELSSIQIKDWSPDTPYLKALKNATSAESCSTIYFEQRKEWLSSPAFYLDCAGFFIAKGERVEGIRILSNLAELKIEDAALLRVFAWRMKQAEEYTRAVDVLRRVIKLRGEEPQSYRDLALVLMERGKKTMSKSDIEEAMNLLLKVATTPWERHADSITIFALEELNALVAWSASQSWKDNDAPVVPEYEERFKGAIDVDVRIVMSWDANSTDIDLHVLEPTGEEAFYGNNRTDAGGYVSRDITDGYGPEEYMIRRAPKGVYKVKSKYFSSHQQTLVGPATVTATVYTDWGRKTEKADIITLRLDTQKDMVDIGAIRIGQGATGNAHRIDELKIGFTEEQVVETVGKPDGKNEDGWTYLDGARTIVIEFNKERKLLRVIEKLPGGIHNIILQ